MAGDRNTTAGRRKRKNLEREFHLNSKREKERSELRNRAGKIEKGKECEMTKKGMDRENKNCPKS